MLYIIEFESKCSHYMYQNNRFIQFIAVNHFKIISIIVIILTQNEHIILLNFSGFIGSQEFNIHILCIFIIKYMFRRMIWREFYSFNCIVKMHDFQVLFCSHQFEILKIIPEHIQTIRSSGVHTEPWK